MELQTIRKFGTHLGVVSKPQCTFSILVKVLDCTTLNHCYLKLSVLGIWWPEWSSFTKRLEITDPYHMGYHAELYWGHWPMSRNFILVTRDLWVGLKAFGSYKFNSVVQSMNIYYRDEFSFSDMWNIYIFNPNWRFVLQGQFASNTIYMT